MERVLLKTQSPTDSLTHKHTHTAPSCIDKHYFSSVFPGKADFVLRSWSVASKRNQILCISVVAECKNSRAGCQDQYSRALTTKQCQCLFSQVSIQHPSQMNDTMIFPWFWLLNIQNGKVPLWRRRNMSVWARVRAKLFIYPTVQKMLDRQRV